MRPQTASHHDPRDLGGRAKLHTPGPPWQRGGTPPFRRPASLAFAPPVRVQPQRSRSICSERIASRNRVGEHRLAQSRPPAAPRAGPNTHACCASQPPTRARRSRTDPHGPPHARRRGSPLLSRGWHRRRAPRCHRQRTRAAEAPLAGACGETASVSARLPAAARWTGRPSSRAAPSEPSGRPHRSVGGSSVTTAVSCCASLPGVGSWSSGCASAASFCASASATARLCGVGTEGREKRERKTTHAALAPRHPTCSATLAKVCRPSS